MAITNNGQPQGPIQFTDSRPGGRIFIGPNTPSNPTDGDVWLDSDILNNAGKNLLSTVSLNLATTKDLPIVSEYKDLHIVFRGVQTSANATINITVNGDNVNYAGGATAMFSIPNFKSGVTTNHMTLEIIDTQDAASFSWGYLKGFFTNTTSNVTIIDQTGVYTQTAALNKVSISVSTGTFTGGTALVYGVN